MSRSADLLSIATVFLFSFPKLAFPFVFPRLCLFFTFSLPKSPVFFKRSRFGFEYSISPHRVFLTPRERVYIHSSVFPWNAFCNAEVGALF